MKNEIIALLLALVLLYGCAQPRETKEQTSPTGSSQTGAETTAQAESDSAQQMDTGAFQELDDFSSLDVEIPEIDSSSDFTFDESLFQ